MAHRNAVVASVVLLFAFAAIAAPAPRRTRRQLEQVRPANAVTFSFEHEDFGSAYDPWSLESAEYEHRFDFGSVIGRVNHAQRFGKSGTQVEADAYPHLGHGVYLYTNLGFSSGGGIFPKTRAGVEVYKSLPNAYEASVGVRHMQFAASSVTLFTGTIAKYQGNYYYSARPYLSHGTGRTSMAGELMLRNYFATADDYAQLSATFGSAPTYDVTPDAVTRQQSWSIRAGAKHAIYRTFLVAAHVGYRSEQIRQSTYRRGWIAGAGVERRF